MRINAYEGPTGVILLVKRQLLLLFYISIISFTAYFILYSFTGQLGCKNNQIKIGQNDERFSKIDLKFKKKQKILKLQIENSGCSGLGNMMFRLASMVNFSITLYRQPCIQSQRCPKNYASELLLTWPNLPKDIFVTNCGESDLNDEVTLFAKKCWTYDNISKLILSDPKTDIFEIDTSYLQSFKFFDRSFTRRLFDFSQSIKSYVDEFAKNLFLDDYKLPKICVHLRGGDFSEHILLPSDVESASDSIDYLLKTYTIGGQSWLVLFSDDIRLAVEVEDYVANVSIHTKTHIINALSRTQSLYFSSVYCDMFLISSPGSTFGWWLAYLMNDQKQHQVFYIDRFFKSEHQTDYLKDFQENDFFPPEWQRLNLLEGKIFSSRDTNIYGVFDVN